MPTLPSRLLVALAPVLLLPVLAPVSLLLFPSRTLSQEILTQATPSDRLAEADRLYQEGTQLLDGFQNPLDLSAYDLLAFEWVEQSEQALEQSQRALDKFQQALAVYREIGDRPGEAAALHHIGTANWYIAQFSQNAGFYQVIDAIRAEETTFSRTVFLQQASIATDFYQQALAIYQEIGDRQGQVTALTQACTVHVYLAFVQPPSEQAQPAVELCQQAVTIAQTIEDPYAKAVALNNLGDIYQLPLNDDSQAIALYQQVLSIARDLSDRQLEAETLYTLGTIEQPQSAIESLQQALAIFRELGDSPEERLRQHQNEAYCLMELGRAYGGLGQSQQEIDFYQQALVIWQELGDRREIIRTLNNLGFQYHGLGQYQQAIEVYQQLLDLSRQEGTSSEERLRQREREARALIDLGRTYISLGQYQLAIEFLQQALNTAQEIGDQFLEEYASSYSGILYNTLGYEQGDIEVYQQLLTLAQQRGDIEQEMSALAILGWEYQDLEQYQQAIEVYQQRLVLLHQIPAGSPDEQRRQRVVEILTLDELGSSYFGLEQYQQAIDAYQQGLRIAQEIDDDHYESALLRGLGRTYNLLGQYQQAIEMYQQVLSINQEDDFSSPDVLFGLVVAYRGLGQEQQVIEVYLRALETARSRHTPTEERTRSRGWDAEIVALFDLGEVYSALEKYPQAIAVYQEVLAIAQQRSDSELAASALFSLGETYVALRQEQEAKASFRQSLEITRQLQSGYIANTLMERAVRLRELGQLELAIEFYQHALNLFAEQADFDSQVSVLQQLSQIYGSLEQHSQAIEANQQGLDIARQVGDRPREASLLSQIAQLLVIQNQPELAIVFYKQSVNVREAIRQDIQTLPQAVQEAYVATIAEDYRALADLLLQQDRVLEVQQVLDLLKVQELQDYLQDVRGNEQTVQGVEYWQPEQQILDLYDRAIAQGQELARLRDIPMGERTPAQQRRLTELVADEQSLNVSFDEFINSPEVVAAVQQLSNTARRQNLDLAQLNALQDNLRNLNQNAVLLYPLILDDRLELVLVTPNSPPIRRTVAVRRDELNRAIAQFRILLTNRTSNPIPQAHQLYQWLIAPIEQNLEQANAETILYAPDGALRYIPLAALHDGDGWLIQRFRINYITAASLTDFDTPPQPELRVLAGAFSQGHVSFTIGTRQFSFAGLPFAGVEVNNIAAEIPGTMELFDQQFSPAATIPVMDDFTVVHLATHAEFVSGSPEESFILFGNGDRINLRDMATWSLPNVDLVVLSACKTAVGSELGNGEEILGFGYQIQRTGARAAIASLWSVDDGGTQVLMNAFYAALEQGMTKAEALRQAQIALITGDFTELSVAPPLQQSLARPYYWAPFILIGNGL